MIKAVADCDKHVAVGYRVRADPEFKEVVEVGGSCERYAKEFVRKHELTKCRSAVELVPTTMALDKILWESGDEDVLNKPHCKLMARKAPGLIKAYEQFSSEEDWSKGRKAGKNGRAKCTWMRHGGWIRC